MLHNNPALLSASHSKITHQLREAEKKLSDVRTKITMASTQPKKSTFTANEEWTKSYAKWEKYEDMQELEEEEKKAQRRYESVMTKMDPMGHSHDHGAEKQFFEKSEEDKMKLCEYHRLMGNYLYREGLVTKATDSYKIAIAYYEYCFPDDADVQQELDELRHACLCNVALCYVRLGFFRDAIASVSHVIRETKETHSKAFFRRAQAYRGLDEYDNAMADVRRALQLRPGDGAVVAEMGELKGLMERYGKSSQEMAKRILNTDEAAVETAIEMGAGGRVSDDGCDGGAALAESCCDDGDTHAEERRKHDINGSESREFTTVSEAAETVFNCYLPLEPTLTPAMCVLGDCLNNLPTP